MFSSGWGKMIQICIDIREGGHIGPEIIGIFVAVFSSNHVTLKANTDSIIEQL
ncbi:hypothetical protein AGABI2DRAFT_139063 [Agaricus bisporus var. bisporus H97]|uniref:hypothetical protein n=1 Tax=Agaricus bisporus var. bisporus (strain H97 / ATCC MYA-4626 / FGSC 10389) TaxID=936046 RepID=UPI00029F7F92|nr:hypothetical protein AGABI2DRAFT_139063 [Agaricus bisporus var. bisporus H97]EKV43237.1 hypothetical protein AGABI2DRAFT_139063 [Agaricus bisporus var. bisporus H97]